MSSSDFDNWFSWWAILFCNLMLRSYILSSALLEVTGFWEEKDLEDVEGRSLDLVGGGTVDLTPRLFFQEDRVLDMPVPPFVVPVPGL